MHTDEDKTLYAIGMTLGRNTEGLNLSERELRILVKGLEDAAHKVKPQVDLSRYLPKAGELLRNRGSLTLSKAERESEKYLLKAEREPGAQRTERGAIYKELFGGKGPAFDGLQKVKLRYRAELIDGTVVDASPAGRATEFMVDNLLTCWREALKRMKQGGKSRVVCPADIAYGTQGRLPRIPAGVPVIFDLEFISGS